MIELLKSFVNLLFNPSYALTITILLVLGLYRFRHIATQNKWVAGAIIGSPVVFFALSAFDPNFWIQFKRPDNIPIAIMMFLVVFTGLLIAVGVVLAITCAKLPDRGARFSHQYPNRICPVRESSALRPDE